MAKTWAVVRSVLTKRKSVLLAAAAVVLAAVVAVVAVVVVAAAAVAAGNQRSLPVHSQRHEFNMSSLRVSNDYK
jgi:hypothetical protein